jgi:hypothetical protein
VFGISFAGEQTFFVVLAVVFAVLGILVLILRRGRFGRLMAVIGGITTVSGALIGGLLLGLLQTQEATGALAGLVFLFTGAAAVSLGRNPHGVGFFISQRLDALRKRIPGRAKPSEPTAREEVPRVAAAAS